MRWRLRSWWRPELSICVVVRCRPWRCVVLVVVCRRQVIPSCRADAPSPISSPRPSLVFVLCSGWRVGSSASGLRCKHPPQTSRRARVCLCLSAVTLPTLCPRSPVPPNSVAIRSSHPSAASSGRQVYMPPLCSMTSSRVSAVIRSSLPPLLLMTTAPRDGYIEANRLATKKALPKY